VRIGIYNDWWLPDLVGGTEKSALEISEGLANFFGPDNLFVVTPSNRLRSTEKIVNSLRLIRVGSLTLRKRYLVPKYVRILERVRIFFDVWSPFLIALRFSHLKVDAIVIHNLDRVGVKLPFFASRFFGLRVIRVVHDLSDTCIRRTRFKRNSVCVNTCLPCKPKLLRYRWISAHCFKAIICNSQFTMNKLKLLGLTAPHLDYGYVKPSIEEFRSSKASLSFHDATIRVGFVGRISPEKGIETILESFSKLRDKKGSLYLVGNGQISYIESLRNLALDLDIELTLYPYSDKPYELLREKIDLIIVPSLWEEALGRVAFEAISQGYTVIVSDLGGLPESASLAGREFYKFPAGDSKSLAQLIDSIVFGDAIPIKGITNPKLIINSLIELIANP
jgi:glycosyltransferase involved in cell wall biosynthesis